MQRARVRRGFQVFAGGVLLTGLVGGSAWAQTAPSDRKGRFHFGPVWFTPRIVLRSAGNDSNVFNDAEQPISDRSAVLEPSVDALLPVGRRFKLLGYGAIGFNYFDRESEESSTDRSGSLRGELELGPALLFGGIGGGWHRQRFSLEVDQRFERTDKSASTGLTLKLGRRLRLGGNFVSTSYRYEEGIAVDGDAVSSSLDRDSRTLAGSVAYDLTSKTALRFQIDTIEDRFLDVFQGTPDVVRSYRYQAGFAFAPGALVSGQLWAGFRHYPGDSAAAPGYDGTALGADLLAALGDRGSLQLSGSRDVNYAVQLAPTAEGDQRNSYVLGRYGATLNTELPLSLLARGWAFLDRADYVLPYLQDGAPLDRVDEGRSLGVGLFRAFGANFRVGATVEWMKRRSNRTGFGYDRRVYGISAEYTP